MLSRQTTFKLKYVAHSTEFLHFSLHAFLHKRPLLDRNRVGFPPHVLCLPFVCRKTLVKE